MKTFRYLVIGALIALTACAPDETPERPGDADIPFDTSESGRGDVAPADEPGTSATPDTAGWTAGQATGGTDSMATLIAVRAARHDEYERIVFEFGAGPLPGYKVEYVDRPVRSCGSGEVVALPGDAWLTVRLYPAAAHTEEGHPTVAGRQQVLNYDNIKQLNIICDFEAVVEWVIAVASPNRFRVLELGSPARLVVDVRKAR